MASQPSSSVRERTKDVMSIGKDAPSAPDVPKKKKRMKSPPRSICYHIKSVLKWAFLIGIIPPVINYGSLKKEAGLLIPQDAVTFDVSRGQNLVLRCHGKNAPTIIFDAPTGVSSDIWSHIIQLLKQTTRVCTYDRAGIGFSDRPVNESMYSRHESHPEFFKKSEQFTVEKMADDLKRLITEVSTQPQPFILVGSELGALVSRFYSHLYDDSIYKVILLDPISYQLFNNPVWADYWNSQIARIQFQQFLSACGVTRLALVTGLTTIPEYWSTFPDKNCSARQQYLACHPRHLLSASDEFVGVVSSTQQIRMLSTVKPLPKSLHYTVLFRSSYDSSASSLVNEAWRDSKKYLSQSLYVPPEQLTVVEMSAESTQESLMSEGGLKVVRLIKQYVTEYRKGKPVMHQNI